MTFSICVREKGPGFTVDDAIDRLLVQDKSASLRQVHGVDVRGGAHAFTGQDCDEWSRHRVESSRGITATGNHIHDNDIGIYVFPIERDESDVRIDNNSIVDNRIGVDTDALTEGALRLRDNLIAGNSEFGVRGLSGTTCQSTRVTTTRVTRRVRRALPPTIATLRSPIP